MSAIHPLPSEPQFGEDVKPTGPQPQMGEVPPTEPALDLAAQTVLGDMSEPNLPLAVADDEYQGDLHWS